MRTIRIKKFQMWYSQNMFTRLSMWCWMWYQTSHQTVNIVHWSLDEVKRHQWLLAGHLGWWGWTLWTAASSSPYQCCLERCRLQMNSLILVVSGVRFTAVWYWFTILTSIRHYRYSGLHNDSKHSIFKMYFGLQMKSDAKTCQNSSEQLCTNR